MSDGLLDEILLRRCRSEVFELLNSSCGDEKLIRWAIDSNVLSRGSIVLSSR